MRPALACIVLAGCAASQGASIPPRVPAQSVAAVPPAQTCTCLPDLRAADERRAAEPAAALSSSPAPKADAAHETGPPSGSLIRVVAGAGGLLTGNPPAWALAGQLAFLLVSAFGRRRQSKEIHP